jgi:hypothetical protein
MVRWTVSAWTSGHRLAVASESTLALCDEGCRRRLCAGADHGYVLGRLASLIIHLDIMIACWGT